jgi:multiple sugar transport system substrate-binding protein
MRIVINKEDVNKVIDDEAQKLQEVLNTAAAPCWKPDPASTGTCQVGAANP